VYNITEEQIEEFGDYVEDDNNHTEEKYKNARGLAARIRSQSCQSEWDVLIKLIGWLKSEQLRYDEELSRITKFNPHLYDKPLCLATDSSMCGQVLDKIAEFCQNKFVGGK